ncbi:MAG: GTPase HflX [bacterium]|nr:MAG: GTPase HflX [bacterium]
MLLEEVKERQNAILVGIGLPGQEKHEKLDNLSELSQLAATAGLEVKHKFIQERDRIHAAYFIGPGKVQELVTLLEELDAGIIIFDDDLSPAQIRNLEESLQAKVIDRSTLILDIFAKHARTRESKTQVELAQLQYFLPRLTRQWTHLSRQVGGIGTRGPGETQLETDRRLIRKRIEKLRKDLRQFDKQQNIRRQNRQDIFQVSLIGYTNVGKSTIMNLLSDAGVLVENQLFATLDSIVRRIQLNDNHEVLLGDTVGFIRKLPHHLVASFKSTLDEVREANLLLHVVDVHHAFYQKQMNTVMQILEELGAHQKPILIVFNKIDLLHDQSILQSLLNKYPDAVFLSARRHIGIESLKKKIIEFVERNFVKIRIKLDSQNQKFIHYLHSISHVLDMNYQDHLVEITIKCDTESAKKIRSAVENREKNYEVELIEEVPTP